MSILLVNHINQFFSEKNKTGWCETDLKICLNNWVARLLSWKIITKMVYFYCFLSENRITLCNVFSVHQINQPGGWLIWWTVGWWKFSLFGWYGWWCLSDKKNGPYVLWWSLHTIIYRTFFMATLLNFIFYWLYLLVQYTLLKQR